MKFNQELALILVYFGLLAHEIHNICYCNSYVQL